MSGISGVSTVSDILHNPGKVLGLIEAGINKVNDKVATDTLKILKFEVLPVDFSIVGGELGPTFRLQRLVVSKKVLVRVSLIFFTHRGRSQYEKLINKMYGGAAEDFTKEPWFHGPISRQV